MTEAIERLKRARERYEESRDSSREMLIARGWIAKESGYVSPHNGNAYSRYGATGFEADRDETELIAAVDAVVKGENK